MFAVKKILILWCACFGFLLQPAAQAQDLPVAPLAPATTKVVVVEAPGAIEAFQPRPEKIRSMVDQGICKLSGAASVAQAWKTYVSTQDVVGIKVYSAPGSSSGTRPSVAAAVVEGLLAAGVPAKNIIIWDKHIEDLRRAGFADVARGLGVRVEGSADAGYDEKAFYENAVLGTLVWGDLEFGRKDDTKIGRKSFVSKLLTGEITKIINIAPLLNHNLIGINGCLCSLALGSVDNTMRFELHADRLATAVPEIYALPSLSDHVVLSITDALIGQYEGESLSLLHYSTELNQIWFSKDPVALDMLGIQELDREREARSMPLVRRNIELYQNASLLELGTGDSKKIKVEMVR